MKRASTIIMTGIHIQQNIAVLMDISGRREHLVLVGVGGENKGEMNENTSRKTCNG